MQKLHAECGIVGRRKQRRVERRRWRESEKFDGEEDNGSHAHIAFRVCGASTEPIVVNAVAAAAAATCAEALTQKTLHCITTFMAYLFIRSLHLTRRRSDGECSVQTHGAPPLIRKLVCARRVASSRCSQESCG